MSLRSQRSPEVCPSPSLSMDHLHPSLTGSPAGETPPDDALETELAGELLRSLSTALRSFRLYGGESPMLGRFVESLRQKLVEIFEQLPLVRLQILEDEIRWEGHVVHPAGGESPDLAFLFYKDGIRELTLLSGFEDEVEPFLALLGRAPLLREEEDDLVTLLWEADLEGLRYEHVEPGHEGVDLPGLRADGEPAPVDAAAVRTAAAEPSTSISIEDFQESLYFLDDAELRQVAEEVRREAGRDLMGDLLTALFDRLEDGKEERQVRIIHHLTEVLPSILSSGQFARSAALLRDLAGLAGRPGLLSPVALREIRTVFDQLGRTETIDQLVQTLEEQPGALQDGSLGVLLSFFPPASLAPLIRVVHGVGRPDVRRVLEQAIDRLVEGNREVVVTLTRDPDPLVAAGAARWAGRLGVGAAVSEITQLLRHTEAAVRVAAVVAIQDLRAAAAGRSLVPLLQDPDREVRIAAARALAALDYAPARQPLEEILTGREVRAADRTEKLALFEAFGRLAGGEGVALLHRVLNGKSWLGRGEAPETRACAALAIARVRHPSARESLLAAASDADPVVRTAVARALRGESG
jgi:HEAT repeat protein